MINKIYKLKSFNNQMGGNNDKEIYFIRHGKTIWNDLGKTQGQEADIELNDVGIDQAKQTGKYLRKFRSGTDIDCIMSSPLKRCKQTSKIISSYIDYKSKIIYMDELMEVKKGSLSGLTNEDELMKNLNKFAKDKIKKIKDPIDKYKIELPQYNHIFFEKLVEENNLPIEGIESFHELMDRVNYFIEYLKNSEHKKIIVVTHSGYLEVLLQTIFNLSILPKGDVSNGKNCTICYCVYKNNTFTMISPQNSEHLAIDFN